MICTITPNGVLVMSTIVNNQLVSRNYMGYTNSEAKKLFRQYIKDTYNEEIS